MSFTCIRYDNDTECLQGLNAQDKFDVSVTDSEDFGCYEFSEPIQCGSTLILSYTLTKGASGPAHFFTPVFYNGGYCTGDWGYASCFDSYDGCILGCSQQF